MPVRTSGRGQGASMKEFWITQDVLTGNADSSRQVATRQRPPENRVKPLPEDAIALIPMRNMVLFPGVIAPLAIGRQVAPSSADRKRRPRKPKASKVLRSSGRMP